MTQCSVDVHDYVFTESEAVKPLLLDEHFHTHAPTSARSRIHTHQLTHHLAPTYAFNCGEVKRVAVMP